LKLEREKVEEDPTNIAKAILIGAGLAVAAGLVWWVLGNSVRCDETWTFSSKRFEPAHVNRWKSQECGIRDSDGDCLFHYWKTHEEQIPDRWWMTYVDGYGVARESGYTQAEFDLPRQEVVVNHFRWKTCPPEPLRKGDW
jgi:hypothetical protein